MAPPPESESTLLSLLETSTSSSTPVLSPYSHFLLPFSNLIKANPSPKPQTQTLARSLAKQFLAFLNRSLAVLPKRLSDPAKFHSQPEAPETRAFVWELFDTYKLCLDCLESVSPQLACKPYVVYLQRVRLVYSLEAWGFYKEAEDVAFQVLDKVGVLDPGGAGELLPHVGEVADAEMARLVVEVVVAVVRCVALRRSEDDGDYARIIGLVKEVQPWLGLLDSSTYEKLHRFLVTYISKCALSLTVGLTDFSADTVREFFSTALNEHARSPEKYQISKFVRRILSSLFLLADNFPSVVTEMLKCILDFLAQKSKIGAEYWEMEFLDAVSYCTNKCQYASGEFGTTVAEFLKYLAENIFCQFMFPVGSILRLYAMALSFCAVLGSRNCDMRSRNVAENGTLVDILTDNRVGLCNLAPLLVSLWGYIHHQRTDNIVPSANRLKDSPHEKSLGSYSHGKLPPTCALQNSIHLHIYTNALKFLCQPLAELVNSRKKEFIVEYSDASVINAMCSIQEACDELCHTFLLVKSSQGKMEEDDSDSIKVIINAAVASFTLAIRTKPKLQKNVHLVENIVASKWIEPQHLKYLYTSLYNLGVVLYRNNQPDEASKALKLCCRVLWARLVTLCQALTNHSEGFSGDLSENMVLEFFNEACMRTALTLDVLWYCGIDKVKKIVLQNLERWSVAEDIFRCLPGPMPLVKHWVKVACCLNGKMGENSGLTLFTMLSSSLKMTKRALGKILQQELSFYEETVAAYPEFCRGMQLKVVDILLEYVLANHDDYLQQSIVLVRKAWATRDGSIGGLRKCIQILSEAITLMDGRACGSKSPCDQLVMAYCLRALSLQEAEPNSKQIIQDIEAALAMWMRLLDSDCRCSQDAESLFSGSSLLMLYNVVDLLAIKGATKFLYNLLKLVFRLFKLKDIPLESCISSLWDCRRLGHALCASPVDYKFLMNFSEDYGESCNSMDFWINCLKGSTASLVGFRQNFSCLIQSMQSRTPKHEVKILPDLSVHDIKEAAAELMSSVPVPSRSLFLVGYLYYDLSERLIASGHLFEALVFAKEAHRLRTKLFQEKFVYTIKQETRSDSEFGYCTQKLTCSLLNLHLCRSSARQVWSLDKLPWDIEACYISPWKILQNYLESSLQVGIIHEKIGNANEAETFLLWGKDISSSQNLPLFVVSFCSVLGKLYCKKGCWDLAEKELKNAQQILVSSCNSLSCSKCKLKFEVIIDQQLGNFHWNCSVSSGRVVQREELCTFETLHRSSLEKLNCFLWKNSVSCPEEIEVASANTLSCYYSSEPSVDCFVSAKAGNKTKMEAGDCTKPKKAPESSLKNQLPMAINNHSRVTRYRHRLQNQDTNNRLKLGLSYHLKGYKDGNLADTPSQSKNNATACICNRMKCWLCLVKEVEESGLLSNFIHLQWEIVRRRLSLIVLSSIGQCVEAREQIHEVHSVISQSITVLTSRNPFSCIPSPLSLFFNFVGKELSNDVFAVEKAELIYRICWFVLKSYTVKSTRTICCDISGVQLPTVVSCLMMAFVLCCNDPVLFRQVSRLLSVIFLLSSSSYLQPLRLYCKSLSESHWASFFHQASIGTHFSCQFFLNMIGKGNAGDDISNQCFSRESSEEACNFPRLAPESFIDLEKFVKDFFSELPCTPVICISMVGGQCGNFLQDLLECSSCSWMLLSRLNAKYEPVVMLLPLDSVSKASQDDGATFNLGESYEDNSLKKCWQCPWGFTIIDDVAPQFRLMLEENYISSSIFPLEDTQKSRRLWWMHRKKLDSRLGEFLRKLEDSWFGPWRYLLLGEQSNCERMDSLLKNLARNLKSKCKMDINLSLLRVIVQGARHSSDIDACFSMSLSLRKGCVLGKPGNSNDEMCERLPRVSERHEIFNDIAIQLVKDYVTEHAEENSGDAEPLILVPDYEVQMLPWENLPILREQEVYRMPSVGNICFALDSIRCRQQKGILTTFPFIDPLDAFYLINPAGDLTRTQVEFQNLFQEQNFEGKSGTVPSTEELALALKTHDLFIYLGHGSGMDCQQVPLPACFCVAVHTFELECLVGHVLHTGAQYISCQEIQKLEHCSASLLLGCSSGSLSLNGPYIPQGTPLAYLLAGSPVIVANLWEVTDVDIDRFGKAMLQALLNERSSPTCTECELTNEFESMNIKNSKCNTRKKSSKKVKETGNSLGFNGCVHRRKIGSFMYQAREACRLPYLIGASPVCYGVPTGIGRKGL